MLLELVLDDRALFLDHKDLVQALGELAQALALDGPGHRNLVKPDADLGGVRLVDAKGVEGLADVEIGLAGGDDAEPRIGAVDDRLVELVGAGEGDRRIALVAGAAVLPAPAAASPASGC